MENIERVMFSVRETIRINLNHGMKDICGYFKEGDEYFLGCRFFGVCLNEHIPDLKKAKEPYFPLLMSIKTMRKNIEKNCDNLIECDFPSLDELDKGYEEVKRNSKNVFTIFRETGNVNGIYLLHMYNILGSPRVYIYKTKKKVLPYYLIGENGEGVLMQYRKKE